MDGCIKVGDFGQATDRNSRIEFGKRKNLAVQDHTGEVGTMWYRAPELDKRIYDHRVDIFSLGVILFELITPMLTNSERYTALHRLRTLPFPKKFDKNFETEVNFRTAPHGFYLFLLYFHLLPF